MTAVAFELSQKGWLVLLVLLPCVYLLSRGSLAGLDPLHMRAAIGLRTAALLLIVLGLARLRVVHEKEGLAVIFAVDRSDSVPAGAREEVLRSITEVAQFGRRDAEGDLAGLLVFGEDAGIEVPPRAEPFDARSLERLPGSRATDLQAAVRLAVAAFPERSGGRRIVLFTDGNENRGDVLEEVRNARALGVTVDVVPIGSVRDRELWIDKVRVPVEVRAGEPFDLHTVAGATRAMDVRVSVYEDGALVSGPEERSLPPGKSAFVVEGLRKETPGFHEYEVRIEPRDRSNDGIAENNSAPAVVFIRGEPRVLYVLPAGAGGDFERQQERDRPFLEALVSEQIAADTLRADLLPAAAADYLQYGAIVFSNVPAHELSEERMDLIHGLVHGAGVGFLMLGGENSFGAGGFQGTPIERLLPVDMEVRQRSRLPQGALAIVVHSSELGNGNWWAREVIQRAIRVLSPRDYCGVLYYDGAAREQWLFPMTLCREKPMMLRRLRGFEPGDMVSFQEIVRMAAAGLAGTRAAVKHLVILSDGDPGPPDPKDVEDLVERGKVTISTICYGAHGDVPPLMPELAEAGNGTFHHLKDPRRLPEIFIREAVAVRKSLLSDEPFVPALAARGPMTGALEDAAGGIPALGGYVLATPKPLAFVHLVRAPGAADPSQDPVLATWTYGLGRSAAFTSAPGGTWGETWTAWHGYRRFWAELVRWVSRSRTRGDLSVVRHLEDGRARVLIDAVDEGSGRLESGIAFEAKVVSPAPDHATFDAEVRPTGPGRYELEFPAERKGTYVLTLRSVRDGVETAYTTGVTVPYSAEFRHLEPDEELLRRIADAGGGRILRGGDGDFFSRDYPRLHAVNEVWRQLLTAALLLFFLDIALRRLAFRPAAFAAWMRAAMWRARGAAPAGGDRESGREPAGRTGGKSRPRPAAEHPLAGAPQPAGGGTREEPRPEDASPEDVSPEDASSESSYTRRLLAAKERARRGQK